MKLSRSARVLSSIDLFKNSSYYSKASEDLLWREHFLDGYKRSSTVFMSVKDLQNVSILKRFIGS